MSASWAPISPGGTLCDGTLIRRNTTVPATASATAATIATGRIHRRRRRAPAASGTTGGGAPAALPAGHGGIDGGAPGPGGATPPDSTAGLSPDEPFPRGAPRGR